MCMFFLYTHFELLSHILLQIDFILLFILLTFSVENALFKQTLRVLKSFNS